MKVNANDRQRAIYVKGVSGEQPHISTQFSHLEHAAERQLSPEAFAYIAGGAGQEHTVRRNESAFQNWQIVPRMLRNVAERDLSVDLLGKRLATPLLLCPIGVLELAHQEADLAVSRAAAHCEIPMIVSNQASFSMEEIAATAEGAPRWFQLYWSKSDELISSLVKRAEAADYEAIVVTLDTNLLGWRTRDLDLAYLPFLQGKGIAQYTSDPVFQRMLDESLEDDNTERRINYNTLLSVYQLMNKYPDNFLTNLRSKRPMKAVRQFINIFSRPSLTWKDLPFLRKQTDLPILLKGILHPDDAKKALNYGVDGIIVSNHGGRQVDGSIAAIEALPNIVNAVREKVPVLMDSGIRSGADVFKAIALGAKAVCLGRPYVYGLALGGQAGVEAVIQNLLADFELTMALAGCKNIEEIDRNSLK